PPSAQPAQRSVTPVRDHHAIDVTQHALVPAHRGEVRGKLGQLDLQCADTVVDGHVLSTSIIERVYDRMEDGTDMASSGREKPPAGDDGGQVLRCAAPGGSTGVACGTAPGELVLDERCAVVLRAFGRELRELSLDLAPDAADRDTEHTLTTLDEVNDLVGGGALVDRGAVTHQRDLGEVVDTPLVQRGDRRADLLKRDAGVEQPLDDLEDEDVAEAVKSLASRAGRAPDARLDQAGAGPVVELTVGDARCAARRRPAVSGVLVQVRQLVAEQHALGSLGHAGNRAGRRISAAHRDSPTLVPREVTRPPSAGSRILARVPIRP